MSNWYDNIQVPTGSNLETQQMTENSTVKSEQPAGTGNIMPTPKVLLNKAADMHVSFKGAGIGLVAGFIVSLLTGKSKILFTALGATAGALGANVLRSREKVIKVVK